jgi:hypothetical protein
MAYQDEAMRYMQQTESVLIEEGLCSDDKDCSRKEMAFWTAGGWKIWRFTGGGVTIATYNVPSAAIANKIINRCKAFHSKNPNVPVTVTVYSTSYHHGISKVVAREKIS